MRQLLQHWSHRFVVESGEDEGWVELPQAKVTFAVKEKALHVKLAPEEGADIDRLEQIVAEHLQRFGFKEELRFAWQRVEPA